MVYHGIGTLYGNYIIVFNGKIMISHKLEHDNMMLPSGKRAHNDGKSPSLIGKSSINGPFSIAMLDYQRVTHMKPFNENMMKLGPVGDDFPYKQSSMVKCW